MNIWIIHHYANTPDTPGDARHFSHARELIKRGHRVKIVACGFHHLTRDTIAEAPMEPWRMTEYDGVPFTWIQTGGYKRSTFRRIMNMFDFALRVMRRDWTSGMESPDVIMGSSPHPFAALAAERLAAHYKVPFVLEVRDAWPFVLTEVGGHSRFHPFVMLVDQTMRWLYRRASVIVMFSRHSTALLASYGADVRKILWVPHGVDLSMAPDPLPAPDDGVFTVSYIGAHSQWNSLDAVLDAAKILEKDGTTNVLIRFVGDGDSKASLVARAKEEKIDNVRFDHPVPKKEIPRILHESDAFILNNRKDEVSVRWMSFNKLYEYLAAGRPVIFGSCTENDPVRESGAGVSVAADDPVALAEAIRQMANASREELMLYGRYGREHIKAYYSIAVLVDRYEERFYAITAKYRQQTLQADLRQEA